MLKPGGTLVYAVCSLEPQEGEEAIAAFLALHPGFAIGPPLPGELPDGVTPAREGRVGSCPACWRAKAGWMVLRCLPPPLLVGALRGHFPSALLQHQSTDLAGPDLEGDAGIDADGAELGGADRLHGNRLLAGQLRSSVRSGSATVNDPIAAY